MRVRFGAVVRVGTAVLVVAALAGCGSSPTEPTGHFVFSGDDATPNVGLLHAIGADGADVHKVTDGFQREGEDNPGWSPDGRRIVFDRTFDCATELEICFAVWVVDADGSKEQRLTQENAEGVTSALSPTWSTDGRRIAYETYNDRTEESDIWVMYADGSEQHRLTRLGYAQNPSWSPDGQRIAFSYDSDIYAVDTETGSVDRITKTPKVDEGVPDWSPDGKRIAYEVMGDENEGLIEYDVYVMDVDGTRVRRLSRRGDSDGHPVWSSDGRFIAYVSDDLPTIGDGMEIVIVDAETALPVRRFPAAGAITYAIDWTNN